MSELISAMKSYAEALQLVRTHGLWGYVLIPGVLSILLGAAILLAAIAAADDVGGWMAMWWPWEKGASVVQTIANVFGGLLIAIIGFLTFRQIVLVVTAPIMSILSEKVEFILTGRKESGWSLMRLLRDVVRGLRIALRNLSREVFFTIVLLLLGLIPLFTPFTTFLIFLLQAYYAGFGNMDFALERHFGYRDSVRFVSNHKAVALGNGIVFMLLLFTFLGFLVALPLGTIAATIDVVKRLEE